MADTVHTIKITDGPKFATFKFTNESDGTGESNVTKIDVSSLAIDPMTKQACTGVEIYQIWFTTVGMAVKVKYNANSNRLVWHILQDYSDFLDFSAFSGIPNDAGAGKNGDVLFETIGATNGDAYNIIIKVLKSYG